ncbi:MAG TPA: alpha/beta hydrolase-fold protein [Gaiellaceae bacterium]
MTRREDRDGVLVLGHRGRPVLVFPSQERSRYEWEEHGMVDAVRDLIDAGRVKLYCVDSWDAGTWHDEWLPREERARRHEAYERWVVDRVDGGDVITAGVSMGAFHAANLSLRRPERFPLALCFSGIYDVDAIGWGERGDSFYFNNPADYVRGLEGSPASLLLVAGRGMWEDTTGALEQTLRFASLLAANGIRHELDVWGEDAPHDWPAWRAQLAKHLQRFV